MLQPYPYSTYLSTHVVLREGRWITLTRFWADLSHQANSGVVALAHGSGGSA